MHLLLKSLCLSPDSAPGQADVSSTPAPAIGGADTGGATAPSAPATAPAPADEEFEFDGAKYRYDNRDHIKKVAELAAKHRKQAAENHRKFQETQRKLEEFNSRPAQPQQDVPTVVRELVKELTRQQEEAAMPPEQAALRGFEGQLQKLASENAALRRQMQEQFTRYTAAQEGRSIQAEIEALVSDPEYGEIGGNPGFTQIVQQLVAASWQGTPGQRRKAREVVSDLVTGLQPYFDKRASKMAQQARENAKATVPGGSSAALASNPPDEQPTDMDKYFANARERALKIAKRAP